MSQPIKKVGDEKVEKRRHWLKPYRTEVAASLGSVLSYLSTYPLESLKVRQQTGGRHQSNNLVETITRTLKNEGRKGFTRGFFAPLCSITMVRTASFSAYQSVKYQASETIGRMTDSEEPLVAVNRPGSLPTIGTAACFTVAGMAAGGVAAPMASPFELVKNAQILSVEMKAGKLKRFDKMTAASYAEKGVVQTFKTVIKNLGPQGLFVGFRYQLAKDTVGNAVFFGTYESLKQVLVHYEGGKSATSPGAVALAGALCGIVSLTSTYPIESAKSRLQKQRLANLKETPYALPKLGYLDAKSWNGFPVAAVRSAVNACIFFSVFELVKKHINRLPDREK